MLFLSGYITLMSYLSSLSLLGSYRLLLVFTTEHWGCWFFLVCLSRSCRPEALQSQAPPFQVFAPPAVGHLTTFSGVLLGVLSIDYHLAPYRGIVCSQPVLQIPGIEALLLLLACSGQKLVTYSL